MTGRDVDPLLLGLAAGHEQAFATLTDDAICPTLGPVNHKCGGVNDNIAKRRVYASPAVEQQHAGLRGNRDTNFVSYFQPAGAAEMLLVKKLLDQFSQLHA